MPMVAWYMLSKESYMKRVIREVLPTVRGGSAYHGPSISVEFDEASYHSVHQGTLVFTLASAHSKNVDIKSGV